jgi:hypothetical protein
MVRLFFYGLMVLGMVGCQPLDKLPFTLESNSPIFNAALTTGNREKLLQAGIDSYYMFTKRDTVHHMVVSTANLAPSFMDRPRREESFVYSYIGANLALDENIPIALGAKEFFMESWLPSWGVKILPLPTGIASSVSAYTLLINGQRVQFAQDSLLILKEQAKHSVMLEKINQERRYFCELSELKDLDFLSQHRSLVHLEAKGSDSIFLKVETNIDQPVIKIFTPLQEELTYESGMQLDLYGEYTLIIESLSGQAQYKMNFWVEYTDGVNLQFIGFISESQKLGVLDALGASIVKYFDEEGRCFSTLYCMEEDFKESYFHVLSFEEYQMESLPVELLQIDFECDLILRDKSGDSMRFVGKGTLALPRI